MGGEEGGRLILEARARDAGLRVGGVEEPVAGDAPRTRRRRGIGVVRVLDLGVDGIMTDRADVLAEVYDRRGFWPQR